MTTLPGFTLTPGSSSPSLGNIPSGYEPRASGAINDLVFTSPYIVFIQGFSVTVMDASNPGAAPGSSNPNNPSITAGMPLWTVDVPAFGRPDGEQFLSVTALTDPDPTSLGKKVYILATFQSATNYPTGFSLVTFDTVTAEATLVGQFDPPAPFSGPQAIGVASVTLVPELTGDVSAFMWAKASAAALPPNGMLRLYSMTALSWTPTPVFVDLDLAGYPFTNVGHSWVRKTSPTTAYLYAPTGANAFVMQLGCVPPQSPATSGLRVFSGGTELPADGTATAYLGDSLSVQPTVAPSNAIMPISSWNVDWNFHAASEDAGAGVYPRLRFPDSTAAGDPGGPWTYVGPCDPKQGGDVPTGANCWNSVLNNGGFGGPDFTANPAPGSTKALSFALEACNSFTPCSNGPAVFTINWKVPVVRLRGSAVITGAAVQDGSDGHPTTSGYKWYFGSNPAAPAGEALVQDTTGAGCNGTSSCVHAFPGPGTYNVWLTVPYANGYVTPDCAACTSVANGLKVTVTGIVPAFVINNSTTAPTSAFLTQGSLRVDNQSQVSAEATVTGYVYCLSPAGTACTPAQPFTPGPGAIPLAQAGNFWLYIGINFTKAGVSQPRADWSPAVPGFSDPNAWPVNIQSQLPSLHLTPVSPCGGSGCQDVYAYVGDTITAAAYVGSSPDPSPPSGLSWVIAPASAVNVSTGTGQNFSFRITSKNDLTITMNGYGTPVTRSITVLTRPPLSVSVSANPTSAAPGTPISFTANATGGSGSYSSYSWNFGDGNVGTGQSVSHSYSAAQSYTATCTVQDSAGNSATGSASVNISVGGVSITGAYTFRYVDGSAVQTTSVTYQKPIRFTASDTIADSWAWDFGDGTTGTGPVVDHAFRQAGTFVVRLTVTKGGQVITTPAPTSFTVASVALWVIPGLAWVSQGQLPGSSYVSDVAINNPSSQLARYQIAILDGKPLEWKAYSWLPNETLFFDNIVGKWFQKPEGAYGLLVKGDDSNPSPPVISAMTYNNNQGDSSKGTFGVALPVVPTYASLSAGAASLSNALPGLRDVPRPPENPPPASWPSVSAAYTNIGLINTGNDVATVEVRFKSATGDAPGTTLGQPFTTFLAPNQTVQFTRPLQNKAGLDVSANPVPTHTYAVNVLSGSGVVPYASISDIGSTDPVFVSDRGALSSTYRVPGVVRTVGQNQTFFKSRFVLHNPSIAEAARLVHLRYSFRACDPSGACTGRLAVEGNETLRQGETKSWEDFVVDWVNPSDVSLNFVSSWVDVEPADANQDPLVVRADTYNNQPTGNFGTQVPGFIASQDGASPTGQSRKLVISRVVQNASYRTNLALFLMTGPSAYAKVTFFDKNGLPLAAAVLERNLSGDDAFVQINSTNAIWNSISASDKAAGVSVVIEALDGVVGAYASQVDNLSGDQMLFPGKPLS